MKFYNYGRIYWVESTRLHSVGLDTVIEVRTTKTSTDLVSREDRLDVSPSGMSKLVCEVGDWRKSDSPG